ncbi:hypothetical protein [Actinopolymorpha alba]|uniref:hypothetical protein n=1 Tax=Actinopolymorpha alba TaxID=533267 RepID=UPI000380D357|nr:hypothetical protein [Actinopolymorpha alba]
MSLLARGRESVRRAGAPYGPPAGPNRPLPNETFAGPSNALTIDGERFVFDHTGDWHQAGNLFIHLPERKILTAIDSFTVKIARSGLPIAVCDFTCTQGLSFDRRSTPTTGRLLALVGESGCGKSVLASALLGPVARQR